MIPFMLVVRGMTMMVVGGCGGVGASAGANSVAHLVGLMEVAIVETSNTNDGDFDINDGGKKNRQNIRNTMFYT